MRLAEILKEYTDPAFSDWEKFLTRKGFGTRGGRAQGGEIRFTNTQNPNDMIAVRLHPMGGRPLGWYREIDGVRKLGGKDLHSLYSHLGIR